MECVDSVSLFDTSQTRKVLLCIAAPVVVLGPVHASVAQHEAGQVEASSQDGSGRTKL